MSQKYRGLLIGGVWEGDAESSSANVIDPGTGSVVGVTSVASARDVDRAVVSARAAQPQWVQKSPSERAHILSRAAQLVRERVDDIAMLLTQEQGKPLPDSRKEILFGADVLQYYGEEGRRINGSLRSSDRPDIQSIVAWYPVGVVAAIVPWNYPVDLYCWKVAPALASGNAVIVKPPLEAPLAAGCVAQCLVDAGVTPGVFSDIPGGLEAGEALSAHPGIDLLTATASVRTGSAIMRSAAPTLKKLTLELGGQSPFVVLDDADIEAAAVAAARRSFSNTGQICIAVNRILVADSAAEEFVSALEDEVRRIQVGYGLDDGVTCGPATTDAVCMTAERHIVDAVDRGAKIITGGGRLDHGDFAHGHYFAPTVLDQVSTQALIMNEETFGPVVGVTRFNDVKTAVDLANATPYGLAAYVFGQDLDRSWSVANQINAGGVGVNINDVTELQAPFGGWGHSGFGRELGPEGLHGFMQTKHTRIKMRGL